ncbi:hypothetical protein L195_g031881 [Trifolium pratense]|uniref:Uncharacterized protein n=1 Tax=Trifolium pratense TaxID=57577 RepID=A0A2K3LBM6_TRIPR|nr:hypothetical protein L195_g057840 [Trifolium pratense]PNX75936.1 hypothetical protein L195_g031881 [Trifolium pratense]
MVRSNTKTQFCDALPSPVATVAAKNCAGIASLRALHEWGSKIEEMKEKKGTILLLFLADEEELRLRFPTSFWF